MPSFEVGFAILIFSLLGLIFLRMPIAFALGISSVLTAMYLNIPIFAIYQRMVNGLNSFTFLAVPFFILAGQIMTEGQISGRLIAFANLLVGRVRGGLAMVNVLASMLFGGISGSSTAEAASLGSVLIPMMKKQGYDGEFATNVTITASVQGVIIPPSQNMIYYSMAAGGLSVGKLFLGGYIPGITLGVALMLLCYVIARYRSYPKSEVAITMSQAVKTTGEALWGLFTIFIILIGVMTGIFTATESAVVAVFYSLIVTFFIYRTMSAAALTKIAKETFRMLAIVVPMIATSAAFAWLLAYLKVPTMVMNSLLALSNDSTIIILLINAILLILGMFMDMGIIILLVTPILLPVALKIGMDPIQFGIMMLLNLGIGLVTPPVGTTLFVGSALSGIPIERLVQRLLPFYAVMVLVTMVAAFVPQFTLYLPRVFGQ